MSSRKQLPPNILKTSREKRVEDASREPGVTININMHGNIVINAGEGDISLFEYISQTVEVIMNKGDVKNNNFFGSIHGSTIFNNSDINNAGIIAGQLTKADENSRADLQQLLKQISDALENGPNEKKYDVEAVASASQDLMIEANKENPNPKRLKSLGNSLIDTAKEVVDFAPSVINLSHKIVEIVNSLL